MVRERAIGYVLIALLVIGAVVMIVGLVVAERSEPLYNMPWTRTLTWDEMTPTERRQAIWCGCVPPDHVQ